MIRIRLDPTPITLKSQWTNKIGCELSIIRTTIADRGKTCSLIP
jgi:hypothetical protein